MIIISIEGPDGVGKSTQVDILVKHLRDKGLKVHQEHFPRYNTPIGGLIKNILDGSCSMPEFDALQMLYAADQTDFRSTIENLIKEGYDYLILDRYMLSTMVYYCSKMNNVEAYSTVMNWQGGIVNPDITIVMSSDTIITDKDKYKELDVFEKDTELMNRISQNYIRLCDVIRNNGTKVELIYANGTIEEVSDRLKRKLSKYNIF